MPQFLSASSPTLVETDTGTAQNKFGHEIVVQLDVYLPPVSHFCFEVVHLFEIVLEVHVMILR